MLCDSISAWTLNWGFPSKIGSPIGLLFGIVLLWQGYAYKDQKNYTNNFKIEKLQKDNV
jgi:hypothetical protein